MTNISFLFQPYFNNGEWARVMSISKNGSARAKIMLKTSSSELTLEEVLELGWKPTYLIEEKNRSRHMDIPICLPYT